MKLLTLLVALVACTEPKASVTGVYQLATISGEPLPTTPMFDWEYESGRVELNDDSSFVDVLVFRVPPALLVGDTMRGTYRLDGDSLVMRPQGYRRYMLAYSGARLTGRYAEGLFEYRR